MKTLFKLTDSNRRWWVLAATGGSLGIVLLDETVVGVALPTIRDDLGMTQLESHWIVNAYLLALAALVAAGGRLGDLIGLRKVFITGAIVFGIGSIASGVAQSGEWIILSRVLQGFGAAGMWSTGVGMTAAVFGPEERGKAFAFYSFGGTVALCLGPFVGGLLTEVASWRWIFFINIPIVAGVVLVMAKAWTPLERVSPRPRFDYRGLALSVTILVPLVLAIMQGPNWGWDSAAVLGLLLIAALALPAFIVLELRAPAPLIDIRLLKNSTVVASNVSLAAAQFSKMAVIVFAAIYLQDRLGMSPLEAGAALLAATAAVVIGIVPAGRMTDRRGARIPTLLGVAGMFVGLVWLTVFVHEKTYVLLIPGFVLWGASLPFFFTPPRAATMNVVPKEKQGEAGGVMTTSQMLGGTLGVGVLGAVLVDSGSFEAIFGITAGVTAAAWLVCFLLMQRPEPHHLRVPPMAWAHSLVGLPRHVADAISHGTPGGAEVGEGRDS